MEKISSIVPKSRRVSAVDLNAAPAVRPGAPSFGRPTGQSTAGLRDGQTTAEKAVAEFSHMSDVRRSSTSQADIVEQMANSFFLKKVTEAPPQAIEPAPHETASVQGEAKVAVEEEPQFLERPKDIPDEYTPPGTYINITA